MTHQKTACALLSPKAAAKVLGFDVDSVRRAIRDGRLHAVKRGKRWRIPLHALRRYATRHRKAIQKRASA